MKTPSRTLVNWIVLGLVLLLTAILALRFREPPALVNEAEVTASEPPSPSPDALSTASATPTPTALYLGLPAGAIITAEQVGSIPSFEYVTVIDASFTPYGWVYQIEWLEEFTAEAREDQVMLAEYDPHADRKPPLYIDPVYHGSCHVLMLTEDIKVDPPMGDVTMLPAGTRVRADIMRVPQYVEGHGTVYQYSVVAAIPEGRSDRVVQLVSVLAYEYQLAPADGIEIVEIRGTPMPDNPFVIAQQSSEGPIYTILIVTEDISDEIPAGTRVTVTGTHYGCGHWVYDITSEDGINAFATEDQLAYDPSFTPVPTLTGPPPTNPPHP